MLILAKGSFCVRFCNDAAGAQLDAVGRANVQGGYTWGPCLTASPDLIRPLV